MRKTLLATALAAVAIASPAAARDGSPYVGIEGGILFPKDQDADVDIDFVNPLTPDVSFNNAIGIDYKRGLDLDAIAGYDFGMFRLEGELGWKRAKLDKLEISNDFAAASGLSPADLDLDGNAKVLSGMVNGLVDFDLGGVGVYGGGGVGRARVKFAGEKDSAWAYQLIAGVRAPITDNVDLGLKYRYFRTGKLDFGTSTVGFNDAVTGLPLGTATTDFENRFRSHSVLASLIYNFGAPAAALPPPPPPPAVEPAAPPPPATQTCPDGSVVLATDTCPVPPPPPPPPPPAPERG